MLKWNILSVAWQWIPEAFILGLPLHLEIEKRFSPTMAVTRFLRSCLKQLSEADENLVLKIDIPHPNSLRIWLLRRHWGTQIHMPSPAPCTTWIEWFFYLSRSCLPWRAKSASWVSHPLLGCPMETLSMVFHSSFWLVILIVLSSSHFLTWSLLTLLFRFLPQLSFCLPAPELKFHWPNPARRQGCPLRLSMWVSLLGH